MVRCSVPVDWFRLDGVRVSSKPKPKTCITVDLDDYCEYQRLVGSVPHAYPRSFYRHAASRFLDLFDRCGVRATFFMVGRDARDPERGRVARQMVERGHEVANHSYSHPYNFRSLSRQRKLEEIENAESAIADATGVRPVGFRTPSCDVDCETLTLLAEREYLYDSSVFPTPVIWAFMAYGMMFVQSETYQLGHVAAAFAPTRPYVPSSKRIYRERRPDDAGPATVLEIPISVTRGSRIPFYSTLLRKLGPVFFSWLVRHRGNDVVINTLFHMIELEDFSDTPLAQALDKMPALAVSITDRTRFIEHAVSELGRVGNSVPMRELAAELRQTSEKT